MHGQVYNSVGLPTPDSLPAAVEASERRATKSDLIILTTLLVSTLLPIELSFYIGNSRLTIARAALILTAPYVIFRLIVKLGRSRCSLAPSDVLVPLVAVWMIISDTANQGFDHAMSSTAVMAVEFAMPYLATRALCQSRMDVIYALGVICASINAVAIVAILDPIFGHYVVHDWLRTMTGYVRAAQIDFRMGLLRASGTLEHPILLGTLCSLAILVSGVLPRSPRWITRICCCLGLILSWSSGPMGGLAIGLACIVYNRALWSLEGRWALLLIPLVALASFVYLFSNNPLGYFLSNFTLDPESAYFRILIWHYAGINIGNSPLLGIGLDAPWIREDWMPNSVDSFWLWSAMTFGIPAAIAIAISWIWPMFLRIGADGERDVDRAIAFILNVTLAHIIYIAFTVHYWGATWMLISSIVALRVNISADALNPAETVRPSATFGRMCPTRASDELGLPESQAV